MILEHLNSRFIRNLMVVVLVTLSFLNFSFAQNDGTTKVTKNSTFESSLKNALINFYGNRFSSAFQDVTFKKVDVPFSGKDWKLEVWKIQGSKLPESLPILIVHLNNKSFLVPALIDIRSGENEAAILTFLYRDSKSIPYADHSLIVGDPTNCKHKMAIFTDPQCTFCKKFVPEFLELASKNEMCGYHFCFPLDFHKDAASMCKYLELALHYAKPSEKLKIITDFYKNVSNADESEKYVFDLLAKKNIPKEKLYNFLVKETERYLADSKTIGKNVGVRGTPSVFIDGKYIPNNFVPSLIKKLSNNN